MIYIGVHHRLHHRGQGPGLVCAGRLIKNTAADREKQKNQTNQCMRGIGHCKDKNVESDIRVMRIPWAASEIRKRETEQPWLKCTEKGRRHSSNTWSTAEHVVNAENFGTMAVGRQCCESRASNGVDRNPNLRTTAVPKLYGRVLHDGMVHLVELETRATSNVGKIACMHEDALLHVGNALSCKGGVEIIGVKPRNTETNLADIKFGSRNLYH